VDFFDVIKNRASAREYVPAAVSRDALEKLVDAGRRAPTARAVEPWEFVVVTEKAVLEGLGALADHGRFIRDASACIAIYCRDTKYYLEDGCAATENILLAAAALGIGACWVAGDKKDYCPKVSELLLVPPDMRLVSLIPVGRPVSPPVQAKHRPLSGVIHWETFRDGKTTCG